jgi:hypothetical protein
MEGGSAGVGDVKNVRDFLHKLLAELVLPNGGTNIVRFPSLRDVDDLLRAAP